MIHRPVGFVNHGPHDGVVHTRTYLPAEVGGSAVFPAVSTVSFAPGAPGGWPNPSRFLSLPLGTYTWCYDWDTDRDDDGDGYIDYFHIIDERPVTLTVDSPNTPALAVSVDFRTDPLEPIPGRCRDGSFADPAEVGDGPAAGAGGLLDYSLVPGPGGTMVRESITLSVDGATAALFFDLAFQTAVEFDDQTPVCFDNFTWTSGGSNLSVDGARVTGTTELILDFDGGTQCPETEQDDIGVPLPVDITGQIEGGMLVGEVSFEGIAIPFTAAVD
jgi:hypothetical protein